MVYADHGTENYLILFCMEVLRVMGYCVVRTLLGAC